MAEIEGRLGAVPSHSASSMVWKLHDNWHIPADVLIRDIKPRAKARKHA
jgi:hypothetical protein